MGLKELEKWSKIQPFQVEELKTYIEFIESIGRASKDSTSKERKYQNLLEKDNTASWSSFGC